MTQSLELTMFYQQYLTWVDTGAKTVEGDIFYRDIALCTTLNGFAWRTFPGSYEQRKAIQIEMVNQFKDAGLNHTYPFNTDHFHFHEEEVCRAFHRNPARIKWVRDHANDAAIS